MVTRRWLLVGAALVAMLLVGATTRSYVHGFSLVVRAADLKGSIRRIADLDTVPIVETMISARLKDVSVQVRVYAPRRPARQTVLLVSGLHPAGIDEPRLITLARELAKTNVTVVTPDIPELSRFEITPLLTDRIEAAAAWLAGELSLAPTGRIGLIGVSFSGGLAIVAAGRPSLRHHLLYVFSFGGHDDLRRVLEYFCTGMESGSATREPPLHRCGTAALPPPHDYGLAVVLLNVADRIVPAGQVTPLRDAVRRFLWASYLDGIDKTRAAHEFAALRELGSTLPEPTATLLEYVNNRDVSHLGPRLQQYLGLLVEAPGLSPARSPAPSAPVFLLHGRDDNVIPAAESQYLAARLRDNVPTRLLLTALISHAEADQPARFGDVMKLAFFWADILDR